MTVWRIKLNSGRPEVNWDDAKAYCRDASVVGLGWGRPEALATGATLDEVVAAVEAKTEWLPTGPRMIRRFASELADGDLVWTRDRLGRFWLGRVVGPWRYEGSTTAWRWDLNNVRDCHWLQEPFRDFEIPGAVVRSFAGVGQTLRRVPDRAAADIARQLWAQATDPDAEPAVFTPQQMLAGLLDPTDVEDVVLVYLQAKGWVLMPSSRMRDTVLYEAALRRHDGALAIVGVKSGTSAFVPVAELASVASDTGATAFVYSTHGKYTSPPEDHGLVEVTDTDLLDFMAASPQLLPPRIARWLR